MQPDVLKLTDPEAGTARLSEVGGWLLLFCIDFTILTPARALFEIVFEPWAYSSALILCLGVLSLVTGINVWTRTSRALWLTKLMLAVLFCVGLLALGLEIASATFDYGDIDVMAQAVIWFLYFKKSKRVRATFGRSL
jgi:hypothetical protein